MKYNAIKNKFFFGAVLCLLTALFCIIPFWGVWAESFPIIGVNIIPFIYAIVAIFCGTVLFILYLNVSTYALIKADGIHIISQKQGELLLLPWEKASDFRWFSGSDRSADYMMLVFNWNTQFCGTPLPGYHGYPPPNPQKAKPYLLDYLMEKLARGKITVNEIKEIPFLLLISKKRINDQYYALWKAKKQCQNKL